MVRLSGPLVVPAYRANARIAAEPQQVFDLLGDQPKLAAHMTMSSAMMGGGRITQDARQVRGQDG